MAETIKVGKKQDLAEVIRQIKETSEKEILLSVEKKAEIFSTSENLKLIKKTGEVLGKTVRISTMDEIGNALAKKAGMLAGMIADTKAPKAAPRVSRSDVRPRFSDIMGPKKAAAVKPKAIPKAVKPLTKRTFSNPVNTVASSIPKFSVMEPTRSSSSFSKYFLLGLVILVVAVFALAALLPKATITVAARSEPVNRDFEISVDRVISVADPSKMQIPGFMLTKEVSETKTFEATGSSASGTKAEGSIVITNLTANTLTLRQATTSLLVDGKKYLFTKDATGIRGNGAANSPIGIVAENPGEEYNIPANTRLEIVNAALGQTSQVYATTSTAVSGGAASDDKSVSEQDLEKATQELISNVIVAAQSDDKIFVDNGVKVEVLAKTANKEVGDPAEDFDMTMIARVTGLAVREADVVSVAVAKINEVLSSDKYLLADGQKHTIRYRTADLNAGRGTLSVHFETVAAYEIDNSNLSKILAGKNEMEIKEILLSKPEVDDVQVQFWPSWLVHKAPRLNGKIEINTVLSQ